MGSNLTCDGHRRFPYTATQKKDRKPEKNTHDTFVAFSFSTSIRCCATIARNIWENLAREGGEKIASR